MEDEPPPGGERRAQRQLERALDLLRGQRRGVGRVVAAGHPVLRGVPGREQRPVGDLDPPQPLDARDPHPAGDDEPRRRAVVGRQRRAVHLVGDEHVVERLADGERPADVALVDAVAHDGRVEPLGQHVDRAAGDPRPLEHGAERHAAPLRHADRAQPPLRARRGRALLAREEAAAVPGALDERDPPLGRQRVQVAQAEADALRAPQPRAEHLQPPGARVDPRRRRVVADEEPGGRRQVALSGHRLPAHLGVRADRDEPLRRERLDDRREGRLRERVRDARAARAEQQRAGRSRTQQVAPRQPALVPRAPVLEVLAFVGDVALRHVAPLPSRRSDAMYIMFVDLVRCQIGRRGVPFAPCPAWVSATSSTTWTRRSPSTATGSGSTRTCTRRRRSRCSRAVRCGSP